MPNSTSSILLLSTIASFALACTPIPAAAQHGGGHAGGGGGSHGGGFSAGGSHGGGGLHGSGFSGAHGGSSSYGGASRGFGGSRSASGINAGSSREGQAYRPWSSEGQGVRNASPGWHGFEQSAGRSSRQESGGPFKPGVGLSGGRSAIAGRGASSFHSAISDGQWHSFGATRGSASLVAANVHPAFGSFNRGFVGNGGFRGPFFHGGFGCCAFGFGWGWGWGWGPGWGWWSPFWLWPSYWYNPWWYDSGPEYIYPNP